jgi:hypothetical protein
MMMIMMMMMMMTQTNKTLIKHKLTD